MNTRKAIKTVKTQLGIVGRAIYSRTKSVAVNTIKREAIRARKANRMGRYALFSKQNASDPLNIDF